MTQTATFLPTSRQLGWIDHARGIGITAVVVGHVIRSLDSARNIDAPHAALVVDSAIYTWHMPLFFVIAGMFFETSLDRRGSDDFLRSKVRTIVWPYLIWSLLQGSMQIVSGGSTNRNFTMGEVLALWDPILHFWFLYALFCIFVVATLMRLVGVPPVAVLIGAAGLYVITDEIALPIPIELIAENGLFFAIGTVFSTRLKQLPRSTMLVALGLSIAFALEWFFHRAGEPRLDEHTLLTAAIGIVAVVVALEVSVWTHARGLDWLGWIGRMAMTIYLSHIIFGAAFRIVLVQLGVTSFPVHFVLGVCASFAGPIILHTCADRFNLRWLFVAPDRVVPQPA